MGNYQKIQIQNSLVITSPPELMKFYQQDVENLSNKSLLNKTALCIFDRNCQQKVCQQKL